MRRSIMFLGLERYDYESSTWLLFISAVIWTKLIIMQQKVVPELKFVAKA